MSTEIGPTWRQAIEKRDGSSASPRPPLMPPVRAWLIWHATPGTLGSSNALTHTRSFGPTKRNVVLTQGRSSAHAGTAKQKAVVNVAAAGNQAVMRSNFNISVIASGAKQSRAGYAQSNEIALSPRSSQ